MSHELVDGRFRIGRVIGKGNMGEVHRAEDLRAAEGTPERKVAVKTILRRRTGTQIDTSADPKADLLGWRDICRATDEPSMMSALMPAVGGGNKFLLAFSHSPLLLCAAWSSFAFDYTARQNISGVNLNFFIAKQLPVPTPTQLAHHEPWITRRVYELAYTAEDMAGLAAETGDTGTPFRWHKARRQAIRAELDALFFHLYGISREDADYILDTFPIVRRKDEATYGSYVTKELILTEYDRMATAGLTLETPLVEGVNYTSTPTPSPGHGPRHPEAA